MSSVRRDGAKSVEGFLVHSVSRAGVAGDTACLYGRLRDGHSFCVELHGWRPGFWVRRRDRVPELLRANGIANTIAVSATERRPMRVIDGAEAVRLEWTSVRAQRNAFRVLDHAGIATYEADVPWIGGICCDIGIRGSLRIVGEAQTNNSATDERGGDAGSDSEGACHVDCRYVDPQIVPSDWFPRLRILSIDIETDMRRGTITALSMVCEDPWKRAALREVLLLGADVPAQDWIRSFRSERALLAAFVEQVRRLDPDIITGWNVIEFDLRVIAQRARNVGVRLLLGRTDREAEYLPAYSHNPGERQGGRFQPLFFIQGRQVIDAMRLTRYGPQRYENYQLQTVARAVLKKDKHVHFENADDKIAALTKLATYNPVEFARYCLKDALLALEIPERSGLWELTYRRCLLTGVPLSRAWGSIAAFDAMYIEELHRRSIVAPTTGVDRPAVVGSSGGGIISPKPGLYSNVLVFDFRSLYPTIMVSFNIDPLSLRAHDPHAADRLIAAPNGVWFSRTTAILPEMLQRFFVQRAAAHKRGDTVASYVYKIIMNSFYGVLGTSACRFGDSRLAGAITGFGRMVLQWSADCFARMGYRVLYGDTDSMFVLSGLPDGTDFTALFALGTDLCAEVNAQLQEYLRSQYDIVSHLELEFEKIYDRFLLPPIRAYANNPNDMRGRAKGYAGRRIVADKPTADKPTTDKPATESQPPIEVIGMEAVRRDWTDLAGEFQRTLLALLFADTPANDIEDYIRATVRDVYAGRHDDMLVYRKHLRKPVASYHSSQPPHVRAAAQLPPLRRRGIIRYLITQAGPQPLENRSSPPDYDHYVTRQLKPVAESIARAVGFDFATAFEPHRQLTLF